MRSIAPFLLGLMLATRVLAGAPYDATNGYAASGYDVVAYFALPRNAPDAAPAPAVPGSERFVAEYQGGLYAFSTAANRDAFLRDPSRYLPAYDGHCTFGASVGVKAGGNPLLWRIEDGRLFFNGNDFVYRRFLSDVPGFVAAADGNWTGLESRPAALDILEDFDPFAAPLLD